MFIRRKVIVGSRGSSLALRQTECVVEQLRDLHPECEFVIKKIKTEGDRFTTTPLASMAGRGVFVKEIEAALIAGEIDIAVHSLKDLPSQLTKGLVLAAIPQREDPRDVLVSRHNCGLMELPYAAKVGTSSPRRAVQILAVRPDVQLVELRGNVDTRLRKAQTPAYDAVVLAAAGLHRLGLADRITQYLPLDVCLPSPGQGALAIETREDDQYVTSLAAPLDDPNTRIAVTAERALVERLGGGCQVAIGAYAEVNGDTLRLHAAVLAADGKRLLREMTTGSKVEPTAVAERMASMILTHRLAGS